MKRTRQILTHKGMLNSEFNMTPIKNIKFGHIKNFKNLFRVLIIVFVSVFSLTLVGYVMLP